MQKLKSPLPSSTGFSSTGFSSTGFSSTGFSSTGFSSTGFSSTGFSSTGFSSTGFQPVERERDRVMGVLIVSLCLFVLSTCSKEVSEEDKLKAIVHEAAESAQKKEIDEIRKHISKSYKDNEGNDYDGVRRILLYRFLRAETLSIFVRGVDAEIQGDSAIVKANLILVRGKEVKSIKDIIPESAAGYRFEMIFKKEDKDWKVVSGSWQDVGAAGLL